MIPSAMAATFWILVSCCALVFVRLVIGPRGADRLTALSVISSLVFSMLVLYGVSEGRVAYLDVALLYAIFGFLGILSVAVFIKERQ